MRPRFALAVLPALVAVAAASGCYNPLALNDASRARELLAAGNLPKQPLAIPTKDEVALVDGRPLTLTRYLELRAQLRNLSMEATLWVGTGTLALQNSAQTRGLELTPGDSALIALYALGEIAGRDADGSLQKLFPHQGEPPAPTIVREEIDRLLAAAVVRRNDRVLAQLRLDPG